MPCRRVQAMNARDLNWGPYYLWKYVLLAVAIEGDHSEGSFSTSQEIIGDDCPARGYSTAPGKGGRGSRAGSPRLRPRLQKH